jgi:hypothetical protein
MIKKVLGLAVASVMLSSLAAAAPAPRVDNPAKPAEGRVEVTLKELWRAGGEDDDVFFGNIGSVQRGQDGKIYVLDTQQSQVQVYSPEGKHLATLGREGEGPGEVTRPAGMFQLTDGRLCLLQSFPGRIVMLKPDGTPGGEATYQSGGAQQGSFNVLNAGASAPGGDMVLLGIRMSFGGSAISDQTFFLSRCDGQGQEKTSYLTKAYQINYADFRLDEAKMDFVWSRFAVGPDGTIYTAPDRNAYLIRIQSPDGTVQREITRAHTLRQRDDKGRQTATRILEAIGSYYPTPLKGTSIENVEAAIAGVYLDDQGNLLVQANDPGAPEPGVFTVLDVFDKQGRFVRQLALHCPGDPQRDGLVMLGGGRVVVLHGALDAWLTQQAVAGGKSAGDTPALEVVCYSRP